MKDLKAGHDVAVRREDTPGTRVGQRTLRRYFRPPARSPNVEDKNVMLPREDPEPEGDWPKPDAKPADDVPKPDAQPPGDVPKPDAQPPGGPSGEVNVPDPDDPGRM